MMITKEQIREHIFSLQDMKYREFHSKLVPGEEHLVGVRVPVLRNYAKELYKEWQETPGELIKAIGDKYYEELLLQAMIIGMQKKPDLKELLAQIDEFVPKIKNWGICDSFSAGLKKVKKYPEEIYEYLQKYLNSNEEFEIRFGVVMLIDYYINEEYIDRVFMHAQQIKHEGYYVRMAVAWLISICFVRFYDRTKDFMADCTLDDFTYNKALQKARESYRISEVQKKELKEMKRKA